jgi:protein involved in polysaccharide export with SLBB domain
MVALMLMLAACAPRAPHLASGEVPVSGVPLTPQHTLSPGDQFEIRFAFVPELNDRVTVGEDGTVSPKLIGSVIVGGLTVPEATARLKPLYAKRLRDAELSLTVRYFAPEMFWVEGEVMHPGIVRSALPLTLERAIVQAGGAKAGAKTGDILVIRRDESGAVRAYRASLGPEPGVAPADIDPILSSFDVVYVPQTVIGSIDEFLALYAKNLPFTAGIQTVPPPATATTLPPQQLPH